MGDLGLVSKIAQALAVFSQIAISITAIVAMLSAVFKPVRSGVMFLYRKIYGSKDKNKEVLNKIEELKNTFTQTTEELKSELTEMIQEVSNRNDENEKDRIRWEILDFSNSCMNNRKHTKEEFDHVIALESKYKRLLEKTGDTNGVFEENYKYIKKIYAERLEKNDFL